MQDLFRFMRAESLTQRQLAQRLGVSASYINELLNGSKTPGLRLAIRIQDETGVEATSWFTPSQRPEVGQ